LLLAVAAVVALVAPTLRQGAVLVAVVAAVLDIHLLPFALLT
jgi:hypothetical protein